MIQIGAPLAHDFSNPLGVLSDCHRRIEHFLHLLIAITEQARGGTLSAEQRDAMEVGLRYFEEAEPKHTADEEESLFPRLRASQHPRAAEALALVDVLAHDHQVAQAHHARVGTLAHRWLTDGRLPAEAARELAERLDALANLYRSHIPVEDGALIPLARRILDAAETAALGHEMAARRGIATAIPERASPWLNERRATMASQQRDHLHRVLGPVARFLAADHVRLDALLQRAVATPCAIDTVAYAAFRAGLLKHIGMEEKILLPAAQRARGGEPLPIAAKLRLDHGALAALLVPTPTPAILAAIGSILAAHNEIEEGPGGVYEICEQLAGADAATLLASLRTAPEVPVNRNVDGPRIMEATRRALARAGYEFELSQ